jgi:hypothetical protein
MSGTKLGVKWLAERGVVREAESESTSPARILARLGAHAQKESQLTGKNYECFRGIINLESRKR